MFSGSNARPFMGPPRMLWRRPLLRRSDVPVAFGSKGAPERDPEIASYFALSRPALRLLPRFNVSTLQLFFPLSSVQARPFNKPVSQRSNQRCSSGASFSSWALTPGRRRAQGEMLVQRGLFVVEDDPRDPPFVRLVAGSNLGNESQRRVRLNNCQIPREISKMIIRGAGTPG
jgi:hypothetical protein